jgi:2-oxoglutarate ferredoxin oxidoreductase subunit alpha
MMKIEYTTGNAAIAEGAIASGLKFFSGYPITPTSDLFEYLAIRLPKVGGIAMQFEDEIGSICAAIGASWGGAKAMTATSGPGFSLMLEGISFAIMTETPLVIVNVMRAGPSTGVPTKSCQYDVMQVRYGAHGNYEIPVLIPWSVQEAFELTIKAFNIAEALRVPTILLSDAILAHTWERLLIKDRSELNIVNRKKPKLSPNEYKPYKPDADLIPPMATFGEGYTIHVESLTHDEKGYYSPSTVIQKSLIWRFVNKIRNNMKLIVDSETYFTSDCRYLIFAFGSVARSAYALVKELRKEGVRTGLFRPKSLWPIDQEGLKDAATAAEKVFVIENNVGLIVKEVANILRDKEVISVPIIDLEIPSPDQLKEVIQKWIR